MYCRRCGTEIPDDSVFCLKCGTPIESVARQPQKTANAMSKKPGTKEENEIISRRKKTIVILYFVVLAVIALLFVGVIETVNATSNIYFYRSIIADTGKIAESPLASTFIDTIIDVSVTSNYFVGEKDSGAGFTKSGLEEKYSVITNVSVSENKVYLEVRRLGKVYFTVLYGRPTLIERIQYTIKYS